MPKKEDERVITKFEILVDPISAIKPPLIFFIKEMMCHDIIHWKRIESRFFDNRSPSLRAYGSDQLD